MQIISALGQADCSTKERSERLEGQEETEKIEDKGEKEETEEEIEEEIEEETEEEKEEKVMLITKTARVR